MLETTLQKSLLTGSCSIDSKPVDIDRLGRTIATDPV
jgi:hypothetical protein